jgi:hypothetical protein
MLVIRAREFQTADETYRLIISSACRPDRLLVLHPLSPYSSSSWVHSSSSDERAERRVERTLRVRPFSVYLKRASVLSLTNSLLLHPQMLSESTFPRAQTTEMTATLLESSATTTCRVE